VPGHIDNPLFERECIRWSSKIDHFYTELPRRSYFRKATPSTFWSRSFSGGGGNLPHCLPEGNNCRWHRTAGNDNPTEATARTLDKLISEPGAGSGRGNQNDIAVR
jgi:hypothetical protein